MKFRRGRPDIVWEWTWWIRILSCSWLFCTNSNWENDFKIQVLFAYYGAVLSNGLVLACSMSYWPNADELTYGEIGDSPFPACVTLKVHHVRIKFARFPECRSFELQNVQEMEIKRTDNRLACTNSTSVLCRQFLFLQLWITTAAVKSFSWKLFTFSNLIPDRNIGLVERFRRPCEVDF